MVGNGVGKRMITATDKRINAIISEEAGWRGVIFEAELKHELGERVNKISQNVFKFLVYRKWLDFSLRN